MDDLGPGLFESLVTEGLRAQLAEIDDRLLPEKHALRSAEAPDRIDGDDRVVTFANGVVVRERVVELDDLDHLRVRGLTPRTCTSRLRQAAETRRRVRRSGRFAGADDWMDQVTVTPRAAA